MQLATIANYCCKVGAALGIADRPCRECAEASASYSVDMAPVRMYYVAVGNHDGCPPMEDAEYADPQADRYSGPIVFEQHLIDCTLDNAKARLACKAMEQCGGGRLARLDFDLLGDPSEPHVVVAGHDGVRKDRGPLVWETYVGPGKAPRDVAQRNAASIERRYGACRIARLVFEDIDGRPL